MKTSTAQDRLSQTLQRIDGAYSPSTIRAYRADFSEYIGFAEQLGKVALPTDSLTVADFIDHLMQRGQKSASIGRSISGISAIHSFNKEADPTKDIEVKLAMRRMYRKIGRHQRQAQGINKDMLDQMLAVTEKDLRGERDRALLLVAYDTLCRRSELLSLQISDISTKIFDKNSGTPSTAIFLRKSKTDQDANGKWLRISEAASKALMSFLEHSQLKTGLIFRGIRRGGKATKQLNNSQVSRIFKKLARLANFEESIVREISGHSTRIGAAQDLLLSGASLPIIMNRGRWSKSDTVMRYVEQAGMPV
jgi:site-specific recombinase XerD